MSVSAAFMAYTANGSKTHSVNKTYSSGEEVQGYMGFTIMYISGYNKTLVVTIEFSGIV